MNVERISDRGTKGWGGHLMIHKIWDTTSGVRQREMVITLDMAHIHTTCSSTVRRRRGSSSGDAERHYFNFHTSHVFFSFFFFFFFFYSFTLCLLSFLVLKSSRKTKSHPERNSRLTRHPSHPPLLGPCTSSAFAMSHQRAASTSSISSNTSDTHHRSNSVRFATGTMVDIPSNTANSTTTSAATPSSPLAISIPRQRSFSSSLSFAATSPSARTFTGSSIITNPSNGYFNTSGVSGGSTTPLSAVFAPLSPVSAGPPTGGGSMTVGSLPSGSVSTGASQAMPVLHRRFSSSFHQLNPMAGTSPNSGSVGSQVKKKKILEDSDKKAMGLGPAGQKGRGGRVQAERSMEGDCREDHKTKL